MRTFLGYFLAILVLVAASLGIWHWRFIEVPDGISRHELADPLIGWTIKPHNQFQVIQQPEGPLLRLTRQEKSEKTPSIHTWFSAQPDVSAIHLRCDTRWEDVKAGELGYTIARIVSMMRDKDGKVMHPPDHGITSGSGTRDWHHSEAVLLVTRNMADLGLEISMLGDHGSMEVKNLEVTAVRNRNWVPAATIAVLSAWAALSFCLIRRSGGKTTPPWRALSASIVIVAAGWFFVFPQPKILLHPMIGSFSVARTNPEKTSPADPKATTIAPATATPPAEAPAVVPEKPPAEPAPAPPPASPTVPEINTSQEPETTPPATVKPTFRTSHAFYKFLRNFGRAFPLAHLTLFTAITLLILTLTGDRRQWRLPFALAILSELIPELNDHLGDWGDINDLLQNITGVGLGLLLWKRIPFLQRTEKIRFA